MIAIAWEALFFIRGNKRASKLPGVHVSSIEAVAEREMRVRFWSEREKREGTPSERDAPTGNVLASLVERRPNRNRRAPT